MRLRQENPRRSSATLIDILEREGLIPIGSVARSTLDRHLDRHDLSRRRLGTLGRKTYRAIGTEAPLELVVGDFHHGPHVRVGEEGLSRRTYFLGFINLCVAPHKLIHVKSLDMWSLAWKPPQMLDFLGHDST